jgi:hypothetical protein
MTELLRFDSDQRKDGLKGLVVMALVLLLLLPLLKAEISGISADSGISAETAPIQATMVRQDPPATSPASLQAPTMLAEGTR